MHRYNWTSLSKDEGNCKLGSEKKHPLAVGASMDGDTGSIITYKDKYFMAFYSFRFIFCLPLFFVALFPFRPSKSTGVRLLISVLNKKIDCNVMKLFIKS